MRNLTEIGPKQLNLQDRQVKQNIRIFCLATLRGWRLIHYVKRWESQSATMPAKSFDF
jgi:hypothetical protein